MPSLVSPHRNKWRVALAAALSFLLIAGLLAFSACFAVRPSRGGGQTSFRPPRTVEAADVALPVGYSIQAVASGFTFPTGVTFDAEGRPCVTESGYSYGEVFTTPRLIRVERDGSKSVIAEGAKNGPWTGASFYDGAFYVAEGGQLEGGKILRIAGDGAITELARDLPSQGDHHTNGPVIGPDGWIYFGQGTATNSGIVGPDNAKFGWLEREPSFHDIPGQDITLTGRNVTTANPIDSSKGRATTGAFSAFGTATESGQTVKGQIPCNGAVMRVKPGGGAIELVAWGFRNPFGLAFSAEGQLYVTDNMYDDRGSRPVHGAGDLFWRVRTGVWYGWPDYHGSVPLDRGDHYAAPFKRHPAPLLARHPNEPPDPVAIFGVHSSANGFDFSRAEAFGHVGEAFVALFGDQAPAVGKVLSPVGFKVVRVNVETGVIKDFIVNRGKKDGPASRVGGRGLERPIAARFDPSGSALYVVDFGVLMEGAGGSKPQIDTGVLWRVERSKAIAGSAH